MMHSVCLRVYWKFDGGGTQQDSDAAQVAKDPMAAIICMLGSTAASCAPGTHRYLPFLCLLRQVQGGYRLLTGLDLVKRDTPQQGVRPV